MRAGGERNTVGDDSNLSRRLIFDLFFGCSIGLVEWLRDGRERSALRRSVLLVKTAMRKL